MYQYLKEKFNWPIWIIGLLSTVLVVYQFLFREGLWPDELSIADNLMRKSFWELLQPLERHQVAPIMFLWMGKITYVLATIFNENLSDHFLRLYPLFCGLGVILLYYKLVLKLTNSKLIAFFSYVLLVLNPIFIYYASEVKQYICELFYAILLAYTWANNIVNGWNTKKVLLFSFIVLLGVLNSSSICFVIFPMALYDGWHLLILNHWQIKKLIKDKQVFFYITRYLLALLFLIAYYFCFLYKHPHTDYMGIFWRDFFATFKNIFSLLDKAFNWLYLKEVQTFVCILGLVMLWRLKDKRAFVLSFFILLVHIIFSYFKLYPLFARFVLYWLLVLPICLATLMVYIYDTVFQNIHEKFQKISILFLFVLSTSVYFNYHHFPVYLYFGYLKEPLSFIKKSYTKEDIVILPRSLVRNYSIRYYTHSISTDNLFEIQGRIWDVFLTKSMEHIASLKKFEKIWIVADQKKRLVEEKIKKNKIFKKLSVELSFCKSFNKQTVCLIQRKRSL